jgi:hypothetical protein
LNKPQQEPEENQEDKQPKSMGLRLLPTVIWVIVLTLVASWFWRQFTGDTNNAAVS